METEYVPLDAAKAVVCEACEKPSCPELWSKDCSLIGFLNNIPAADVVEVVRCGDCRFYFKSKDGYEMCANTECCDHVSADGFCAWAQRRTE